MNTSKIWVCSLFVICLTGCNVTLGPRVEKKMIIVQAGTPIEVLTQTVVDCRVLTETGMGEVDVCQQDIGGWIMMHPDHWKSLKLKYKELEEVEKEFKALKKKTRGE